MSIFDKNPPRVRTQPTASVDSVFANATKRRPPEETEISRILALPVIRQIEGDELEAVCADLMLAKAFSAGKRLFPTQASAVMSYREHAGGFYPIGVGWGKTLISLAVAEHAFQKGLRKSVLFVPPSVLGQLLKVDIPWVRTMIPINVPFHILGGRSAKVRMQIARANRSGCYIMPHSLLSTTDANDILETLDADCFICDEAHQWKNRRAGKTKRALHYINKRFDDGAPIELVVMSGTMTSKSITDYHHLVVPALKRNSPVPIQANIAFAWGQVIDSGSVIQSQAQTGPLLPIMRWAKRVDPDRKFKFNVSGFRDAYRLRLTTAPGVEATGDNEIGVSFGIENRPVENPDTYTGWEQLEGLIDQVQEEYITPNGDEIDHAIHTFKWLYELSAGFYNELVWPTPEALCKKRNIAEDAAKDLLDRAMDHHAAQQIYYSLLRKFLQRSPIGMDTPMEVARMINQEPKRIRDPQLIEAYWSMKNLEFEDMPKRDSRAVRVCSFKIDNAVKFAKAHLGEKPHEGCILWVHHQEVGRWLCDALRKEGIEPIYAPAGRNDQLTAVGDPKSGGLGDRVVVASVEAHKEGKNLQAFQHQLFVQWPRPAKSAEQVLGRLHRNGQEADYVAATTCATTMFDHIMFAACLNDAIYAHQSTGQRQKMVYGTYDPLPRIFSPEFLREQGTAPKILSPEQRDMLQERFGESWEDAAD